MRCCLFALFRFCILQVSFGNFLAKGFKILHIVTFILKQFGKKLVLYTNDYPTTVVPLFKTTHGTKKMWSYIAGCLKIKVMQQTKLPFGSR